MMSVAALPSGTVSLVFTDVEGSTRLLASLGPAYSQAMSGQRVVLREAWAAHHGVELGTEGDSFFVAFSSALDAVAAVVQAQRGLDKHLWPGDQRVRVRMGIHTGTPSLHDGGYVGMDVHRAARIASSANGGQVVLSAATAQLVAGGLPSDIRVRDMGSHVLRDIVRPERLFQLVVDGLPSDFPELKTLGAASSLPRPATSLVGRDGELAELSAVLGQPDVRLVTLTGPGGSGKTRLAVGLAHNLVRQFPDGVYFVPLAPVTTAEVMWTTIAEALAVPPESRVPPALFAYLAHRSALLVLDSLEQIDGADTVVAQLLEQVPDTVLLATSRRPLHLAGEHEHPVPPLELPGQDGIVRVVDIEATGAVQLFVQRAQMVGPRFSLSASNAGDVAAVCCRLDGLPLAIELAAATTKVLSPHALLTRLDKVLDLAAAGSHGPTRHKTLRATITWSYELLTGAQQSFFRRLGIFAGGADLVAVHAVTDDIRGASDPFEMVAVLVDASLVVVTETADGEPRIHLLETIRSYAQDQLAAASELQQAGERHARHYLAAAEDSSRLMLGNVPAGILARYETDHENLREALSWALRPQPNSHEGHGDSKRLDIGMRLCLAIDPYWRRNGYYTEGASWLDRAISHVAGKDSPELAKCLNLSAILLGYLGRDAPAYERAAASVNMCRRLDDTALLSPALATLAALERKRENPAAARRLYEEAVAVSRRAGDEECFHSALSSFALFEYYEQNYLRSLDLYTESLALARTLGLTLATLNAQHNIACALRRMGRAVEAEQHMRLLIPSFLADPDFDLVFTAEDYAAVLSDLAGTPDIDPRYAARLLGAADATREKYGIPRDSTQEAEMAEAMQKTREVLPAQDLEHAYQTGHSMSVEDALIEAHIARSST
jgi:predicted ATPase/class 3 adenylate cyclase